MSIRRVSSKWKKTAVLLKDPQIAAHIPETRKYNQNNLEKMMSSYRTVYVKPEHGSHGKGIMRVEKINASTDEAGSSNESEHILHYEKTKKTYSTISSLHQKIQKRRNGKLYLIQRGIKLLKHQGCPFDLRVMAQKNPQGQWEATGIIGKVAAKGKIVTNINGGGHIASFEALLEPYLDEAGTKKFKKELNSLALRTAKQMEKNYPGIKELGLDIALDEKVRPWILEVNTSPGLYVFGYLPDKSIYRKIKKYARAYGRTRM